MIGIGSGSTAATAFAFSHSPLLIFPRGSLQSHVAAGQENPFPESIEANNSSFTELRLVRWPVLWSSAPHSTSLHETQLAFRIKTLKKTK